MYACSEAEGYAMYTYGHGGLAPSFVAIFRDINPHSAQKFASANMFSLDFPIANELIEVGGLAPFYRIMMRNLYSL